MLKQLLILTFIGFSPTAFATNVEAKAEKIVENEQMEIILGLGEGRFPIYAQKALNAVVRTAIDKLNERGFTREASIYSQQWESQFANYFLIVHNLGLGDHEPLFVWLAKFYDELEKTLGKAVCEAANLDDIKLFNYAIPVTFHPKGWKGDSWDIAEYRAHFVPFAGATVYWIGKTACKQVIAVPFVCGKIANAAKKVVSKKIAPDLSDYVYKKAHGY